MFPRTWKDKQDGDGLSGYALLGATSGAKNPLRHN